MDELIAGDLPRGHQAEVTLEIPLLGGDDALVALRADIGLADSVFFLRNKGANRPWRPACQRTKPPPMPTTTAW